MLFATYVANAAQEKAGENPFDSRNYIYTCAADDRTLNDGVKRYAADPAATQFLVRYYTSTGRPPRPLLALQTTYDLVTNPTSIYPYDLAVERDGRTANFVRPYAHTDGHRSFTPQ